MSNLHKNITTFTILQKDLSITRTLKGFLYAKYAKYAAGGPPIE